MRTLTLFGLIFLGVCHSAFADEFDNPTINIRDTYVVNDRGFSEDLYDSLDLFFSDQDANVIEARERIREARRQVLEGDVINDFSSEDNFNYFPGYAKIVQDPQEGILSKIMMIRQARWTVDVATFIFTRDEMGYLFLYELKEAIKRGVSVRMVVDSIGSIHPTHSELKALKSVPRGIKRDLRGRLLCDRDHLGNLITIGGKYQNCQHATVEIRIFASWFRPLQWVQGLAESIINLFDPDRIHEKDFRFSRRLHDKIMIVDSAVEPFAMAITGGRNISNSYYGLPEVTPATFEDIEVIVKNNIGAPLVTPCWTLPFCHRDPNYSQNRDPNIINASNSKRLGSLMLSHFDKIFYKQGNRELTPWFDYQGQIERMNAAYANQLVDNQEVVSKFERMQEESYLFNGFHQVELDFVHELQNFSRGVTPMHSTYDPDNPQVLGNANSINDHYRALMAKAQKSIKIVSPYFWYPEDERTFMKNWLNQSPNRTVEIISNSVLTTDNPFTQAVVDYEIGPSLHRFLRSMWCNPLNPNTGERDVERCRNIYGVLPPEIHNRGTAAVYAFGRNDSAELSTNVDYDKAKFYGKLHSKYFIIDDTECWIGSHNFDPRSRYHDTEVGFIMHGRSFCQALDREFQILKQRSYIWGSRKWMRLRNHPDLKPKARRLRWIYNALEALGLKFLV